jgi:hypothetical protein
MFHAHLKQIAKSPGKERSVDVIPRRGRDL